MNNSHTLIRLVTCLGVLLCAPVYVQRQLLEGLEHLANQHTDE